MKPDMDQNDSTLAGQTISHYRVFERLGSGGMGEVYLAEDSKLGRKVALKLLSEEYTADKDRLQRFEQEACAASALNHPNILTIYEVGVDSGRHFMATEFIDGTTLRQRMAEAALSISEILDISIQIASALEEAHSAGIVHRDIKPENVMIRRNGYVKLLDFGLAKLTEKDRMPADAEASTRMLVQTDTGVVMGTSRYMSPEQTRGQTLDVRTDLWSFGVVIYEMVAGRPPFSGDTPTDVLVGITQKEPSPLARFTIDVPAELEWIVNKSLRKDREERYQTAKELLTDLRRLKQRLEFEVELERSVSPESFASTRTISAPAAVSTGKATATTADVSAHPISSAEYIVGEIRRHKTGFGIFGLLVIAVIASGLFFYFKRAEALTDRDTILLADFINSTGEPVFDNTLKQALAVQLGQSPFLNIYPDERVREALRFMGRSADERITKDVGREICERQGIKALLVGSISSLGSHYVITLEALNGHSGDAIAREQVEAESKEKVLSALGRATSSLRQKLGESLSSIKKYDVAIEQATTSSLEALKAYAMGNEQRAKGNNAESLQYYQRAIELDPNFAMAYARMAVYYGNNVQLESAKQYAQKAFELRDRVSERERLYISEKYYNYVTGEIDKAIETLQSWAKTFPNDFIPHNNLAVNYTFIGRYEDALQEAINAAQLDPNNLTAATNVIDGFIRLNRYDEAKQKLNELRARNLDTPSEHFESLTLAFAQDDQAQMDREAQWHIGKPSEADFLSMRVAMMTTRGKLKEAEKLAANSYDLYIRDDRKENAAQLTMSVATIQALFGETQRAKATVAKGMSLSSGRIEVGSAALALAICNAPNAQQMMDDLVKIYPRDTGTAVINASLVRAQIELNRGNPAGAVQVLDPVRRYELGSIIGYWGNYLLGEAYLAQRAGPKAAAEFKKILDNRNVDLLSPLYSLSHLGLARAASLSGDTATSRQEYQNFLAAWKDADPDLPILIQAKKEYDQLK